MADFDSQQQKFRAPMNKNDIILSTSPVLATERYEYLLNGDSQKTAQRFLQPTNLELDAELCWDPSRDVQEGTEASVNDLRQRICIRTHASRETNDILQQQMHHIRDSNMSIQ